MIETNKLEDASKITNDLGFRLDERARTKWDVALASKRFKRITDEDDEPINLVLILKQPEIENLWRNRRAFELECCRISAVDRNGLETIKRLSGTLQDLVDLERIPEAPDMSEPRIDARFHQLDQIWEMSVKLMKAGRSLRPVGAGGLS